MSNLPSQLADKAASLVDSAADGADNAIRSSQRSAHQSLDGLQGRLSDGLAEASARGHAAFDPLINEASDLARRGADSVRRGSEQLRHQALQARDSTLGYIQHEPVKAVLIAAGVGAAAMLLLGLATRGRSTRP